MGRKQVEAEEAEMAEEAERRLVAESQRWNARNRPGGERRDRRG